LITFFLTYINKMRESFVFYKTHLEKTYRSQFENSKKIVEQLNNTFSYLVELEKTPDNYHLIEINSKIFNGLIERNKVSLWNSPPGEVPKYILIILKILKNVRDVLETDETHYSTIQLLLRSLRDHLNYLYTNTDDIFKPVFKHLLLDKLSQYVKSSLPLTLFIIQIYLLNNDIYNAAKYASEVMRSRNTTVLVDNLDLIDPEDKQNFQKVYDKLDRDIIEQELNNFRVRSEKYGVTIDPIENYWETFISPQVTQKEFSKKNVLEFSKVIFKSGVIIHESPKNNVYNYYRDTIRLFNMLRALSFQSQASRNSLETVNVEAHVQNIRDNYEKIVEETKTSFKKINLNY
jgi:hypothetical protein